MQETNSSYLSSQVKNKPYKPMDLCVYSRDRCGCKLKPSGVSPQNLQFNRGIKVCRILVDFKSVKKLQKISKKIKFSTFIAVYQSFWFITFFLNIFAPFSIFVKSASNYLFLAPLSFFQQRIFFCFSSIALLKTLWQNASKWFQK